MDGHYWVMTHDMKKAYLTLRSVLDYRSQKIPFKTFYFYTENWVVEHAVVDVILYFLSDHACRTPPHTKHSVITIAATEAICWLNKDKCQRLFLSSLL